MFVFSHSCSVYSSVLPTLAHICPLWKRIIFNGRATSLRIRLGSSTTVNSSVSSTSTNTNDSVPEDTTGCGGVRAPGAGGGGVKMLSASDVIASMQSKMTFDASSNCTGHLDGANLNLKDPLSVIENSKKSTREKKKSEKSVSLKESYSSKRLIVRSKSDAKHTVTTTGSWKVLPTRKNTCAAKSKKETVDANTKKLNLAIERIVSDAPSNSHESATNAMKSSIDHGQDIIHRNGPSNDEVVSVNDTLKPHVTTDNDGRNHDDASLETRLNPIGIQMLSKNLYEQIFKYSKVSQNAAIETDEAEMQDSLSRSIEHLKQQKLWGKKNTINKEVTLKLPELLGNNIDEHFRKIAETQSKPYKELLNRLTCTEAPPIPKEFVFAEGWTKYESDGSHCSVDTPDCRAFVFDVEVCVPHGNHPTLATAVSDKYWYSWCSRHLLHEGLPQSVEGSTVLDTRSSSLSDGVVTEASGLLERIDEDSLEDLTPTAVRSGGNEFNLEDLIPFGGADPRGEDTEGSSPRIIVGHNVSYDRIRIREQYYVPDYPLRFVDTMSLHIAVSGLVQEQRAMQMKNAAATKKIKLPWMSVGSLNNLNDVYKFYCKTEGLQKQTRDIFVNGSLEDIRNDFQNLMTYCAKDVLATQEVLANLLPLFHERFPHPVTLAGVLEMGSSFLPVNHNWKKYIAASEAMYTTMQGALTEKLSERAVEALALRSDDQHQNDPWLWNLDWTVPSKLKKQGKTTPNWYIKLCKKTGEREGTPEPSNMSTSLRVVPKLLRLTWKGYPLHHEKDYGWGYLRPTYSSYKHFCDSQETEELEQSRDGLDDLRSQFPLEQFYSICPKRKVKDTEASADDGMPDTEEDWEKLLFGGTNMASKKVLKKRAVAADNPEDNPIHVDIPGVEFIRLPHKNGPNNNVGNPLAKDFLHKIEDGTLSSHIHEVAEIVLKTTKNIAYWRNARDRILSQNTVWLDEQHLPAQTLRSEEYLNAPSSSSPPQWGAILPQVVVCGTVTRRAVERTWLTASNARLDRIGSELKAMVTAPPGYHFVGADVDSQELWIAALLGDSFFAGLHGSTAMSWMTLQGSKAEGTDLHSNTARTAHISRDQAKVINYGRIYGAGLRFLQTLLTQYNPALSPAQARERAEAIVKATKGEKGWYLSEEGATQVMQVLGLDHDGPFTRKQINALFRDLRRHRSFEELSFARLTRPPAVWVNGSESHTFNCLEFIVRLEQPSSPVLAAAIPRPLEPQYAGTQYMTSRMNWVVQSSAVDYLHLMAVCMRWLAERYCIKMRFSISIHDEVRYLVASEDRYRAALALQVTNLLTRALFAHRVGMPDLPLSVAFFSSVDIDKVLRKDPFSACITPSNPGGLKETYGVEDGEGLSIYQLLDVVDSLMIQEDQA